MDLALELREGPFEAALVDVQLDGCPQSLLYNTIFRVGFARLARVDDNRVFPNI
jgi:hypothetical protein